MVFPMPVLESLAAKLYGKNNHLRQLIGSTYRCWIYHEL